MEFADYVARQRPALMRFATMLTCEAWQAEDLVSDVLTRAYGRWDRISRLDQPHAYVRRMVLNSYLSWRKRNARMLPRADLEADVESSPDQTAAHAECDAMFRRLAALPRRQRAAVVLRFYAGMADREIAAEMGCREGTVRGHISRALTALRIEMSTGPARSVQLQEEVL